MILGAIAPVIASLDTFTLYTVELPSTRLSTVVFVPFSSLTASLDKSLITFLPSSVILFREVLALALNLVSNPLLMLEVAVLTALVIAVLTVPPVTRPVLPSVTVPVPNFSLHLEASSVEMLEASLLALVANLVSIALDNSVILGAIAPVIASLDTFTLYTVELPSVRLSIVVLVPFSNLTASLDKLRITVLPSSVMLSSAVLALAFNVVGSICTVDSAVCKVSPVTRPVLPAAFVPVPNAACQAVLLIDPSFASATFHN